MSSTLQARVYDAIDFSGPDDGIGRVGVFLAWLVNHQLISAALIKDGGAEVTKVRLRASRGSELLTTVCHGELNALHLSEAGNEFAAKYYDAEYRAAFARALKEQQALQTQIKDEAMTEWALYDALAPEITRAHRNHIAPPVLPAAKNRAPWLRLIK